MTAALVVEFPRASFADYEAAGFGPYLLPIIPPDAKMAASSKVADDQRGKVPGRRKPDGTWTGFLDWTKRPTPSADDLARWSRWGAGVGIILAPAGAQPLGAFDVDITDAVVAQAVRETVERVLGGGLVRVGRRPKALLLYAIEGAAPPKERVVFTLAGGEDHAIEFLCRGQQFVAEGIHPKTGAPYAWENLDPTTLGADCLTAVTPDQVRAAMAAAVEVVTKLGGVIKTRVSGDGTDHERMRVGDPSLLAPDLDTVRQALALLPNEDMHEEDWFKMLVAVKAATAFDDPDDGWEVFEDWSAQSGKHDERARARWDAVDEASIGWPTLKGMARRADPRFRMDLDFKALPDEAPARPARPKVRSWRFGELYMDETPAPLDLIGPGLLVEGGFLLIAGPPKAQKSFLLQDLLASAALGRSFLGGKFTPARPLRVYWHQAEMSRFLLRSRARGEQFTPEQLDHLSRHFVVSDRAQHALDDDGCRDLVDEVRAMFPDAPPDIIAFDPFVNLFDGDDEKDSVGVMRFLQERIGRVREAVNPRAGLILVHHLRKTAPDQLEEDPFGAIRGTGAFYGHLDSGIIMWQPDKRAAPRRLAFSFRTCADPPMSDVVYRDGRMQPAQVEGPDCDVLTDDEGAPLPRAEQADRVFLAALDRLTRKEHALSFKPQARGTFAPRAMLEAGEVRGFTQDELLAAMNRLHAAKRIEVGELPWKTSKRERARGIRVVEAGQIGEGDAA